MCCMATGTVVFEEWNVLMDWGKLEGVLYLLKGVVGFQGWIEMRWNSDLVFC